MGGRINLLGDFNHIDNLKGDLETQLTTYELGFVSTKGAGIAFLYYDDLENLDVPLTVVKGATIPAGHYRFRSLFTGISSGYTGKVGFTFWYHPRGYYDGDRLRTLLTLVIRPFEGLVISPTYDRVKVDAPWGKFTTQIAQTAIDYSFSTRLSTRLTLQWAEWGQLPRQLHHQLAVSPRVEPLPGLQRHPGSRRHPPQLRFQHAVPGAPGAHQGHTALRLVTEGVR